MRLHRLFSILFSTLPSSSICVPQLNQSVDKSQGHSWVQNCFNSSIQLNITTKICFELQNMTATTMPEPLADIDSAVASANDDEHATTFREALARYPSSVFWAIGMSMTIGTLQLPSSLKTISQIMQFVQSDCQTHTFANFVRKQSWSAMTQS